MTQAQQVSTVRQLAILSHGRHRVMMMLKAYFDESGHSSDPLAGPFAIGGCVAPLDQWELFEEEWKAILVRFGVPDFHASSFAASQGHFKGWNKDRARREEFMRELIAIIRRHVTRPVGATLPLGAFRQLNREQREALVDPYYLCFQVCLEGASLEAVGLADEERVQVVFARAPGLIGKAAELYVVFGESHPLGSRLGPISFATPIEAVPLQAADLVAYELAQSVYDRRDRKPMQQLREMNPYFQYLPYGRIIEGF